MGRRFVPLLLVLGLVTTETGTAQCSLTWSQKETTWEVTCSLAKGTRKMVQDFEQGFDVATAWVSVLENPEG